MLHRYHAAALATAAATVACEHGTPTETVTIAPTATSATASATATATATATAAKRSAGEGCAADGECSAGLACCQTGLSGKCGGARQQGVDYAPCVILRTCSTAPCAPLAMPPYGGPFIDEVIV
jgi:hypothetical protein